MESPPITRRRTGSSLDGITGERRSGPPVREADRFELCPQCGQAFDKRNLGEVFHHLKPGHDPLPADA